LLRYAVQPDRVAKTFRNLPLVAREILRLCDGRRSVTAIRRESPLEREMTDRVLKRLLYLGLIRALAAQSAVSPSPLPAGAFPALPVMEAAPAPAALKSRPIPMGVSSFSADEEAFFSRGIEHLVNDDYAS
jgi:hypothetical protein